MEKFRKLFGMFTALLVVLGGVSLISCSSDDGGSDGSGPGKEYTLSVSENSVTVAPSGVKKVSVTTNGVFKATSSDLSVATAEASNSAKTVTITGVSTVKTKSTATITLTLNEDSSKTATITVTVDPDAEVTADTYTLALSLDEDVAKGADHITVYYGADSGTYETVDAAYTAGAATATAELKKSLANSSGWFNNIVVTVYDSSNSKISTEIDKSYFDSGTAGATIKISAYTAAEMTLTINFTGDDGAISKVSLLYYPSNGETSAGKTVTGNVTNESVTFTLSKDYASSWGYNAAITAYDSADNDITSKITALSSTDTTFGGDASKSWWAFVADGTTTVSATYSAAQWQTLVTNESFALAATPAELFSKADIKGYTFTALKIEVTGVADSSDAWLTMTAGTAWNGGLQLSKADTADSDGTYTYSGTASSDNLEKYASDGIGLAGTAQDSSVKVVVYYQGEFNEEAHNATAKTSSKTLIDAKTVDLAEASWSNYVTVVEASKFADYTVTQIDVSLALSGTFASGKIAVGKGNNEWGAELTWPSGEETAFSASIASSDLIASIKSAGLTIGGDYNGTATLTVEITYEVSE